jgi:adenine-specific DNA-methyltransferase
MYPRLKLARNLLKDDGVIFISIDDNEVANLRKVCDEIFGEDNFVAEVVWRKKYGLQNDAKYFSNSHEYIIAIAKNKNLFALNLLDRGDEQNARYKNPDNDLRGVWKPENFSVGRVTSRDIYPITTPSGRIVLPPEGRSWVTSEAKFFELIKDNRIWFGESGNNVPSVKRFLAEVKQGMTPSTFWDYSEVGHTDGSNKALKVIFENKQFFDYPKPVDLLKRLLQIGLNENDTVLDFFSGSSTTAHAVMQLNTEDEGNRKFIMVQLPETTDEKSEAYKAGYKNICEIGKERIRRAGEKIIAENSDKDLSNLDIGFKVLKLDSSNIKAWDSNFENVEGSLLDAVENIKEDRSSEDLLYEILLKYGLDLTLPIEEKVIDGKKVFVIGFGALVACLDDDITIPTVEAIAKLKVDYQSEIMRVVFKDASFKDAVVKTNAYQILKQFGIDEVVSV